MWRLESNFQSGWPQVALVQCWQRDGRTYSIAGSPPTQYLLSRRKFSNRVWEGVPPLKFTQSEQLVLLYDARSALY